MSFTEEQLNEIQGIVKQENKDLSDKLTTIGVSIDKLNELVVSDAEEKKQSRRASKITALCSTAGKPELASGLIADETLSSGDVAEKLLNLGRQDNPLTDGDGEDDPDKSEKTKLGKEYDGQAKMLTSLGVSREDYIKENMESVSA